VAAALGFAGAMLNPFTIGIAQGIAGLPLFSGMEYRIYCWVMINVAGIGFVLIYARKIKLHPEKSPVYKGDDYWRKKGSSVWETMDRQTPLSAWFSYGMLLTGLIVFSIFNHKTIFIVGDPDSGAGSSISLPIVPVVTGLFALSGWLSLRKSVQFYLLTILGFTILFLIVGVMGYQWYIMKIATLFFAMGLFSGIAMNHSPNRITSLFLEGVRDILPAALTMPIMAPFSDLVDISRQTTVTVYQFGDGFTNMITPTSGVLIGVLGVARIPYEKWVRWITPFMIMLLILGFLLLIPTVTMNLNGF
jgi:uncharacterized ion transporter superfamily protein YfcC